MAGCEALILQQIEAAACLGLPASNGKLPPRFIAAKVMARGKQIGRCLALETPGGWEIHVDAPGQGNAAFHALKSFMAQLTARTGCNRFTTYCDPQNRLARVIIRALGFVPTGQTAAGQCFERLAC